jgi:hypothetical protein
MPLHADDAVMSSQVEALHALKILDTPQEERFDRIVRLAQQVFGVPMAAVNFIETDRQWTKAQVGLPGLENTAPDDSMCRHTVRQAETLIVPDTTADPRFRTNRFVTGDTGIRFYAGHPLRAPGGERVGSLCLFDTRPREMNSREQDILVDMAMFVERELASHQELDRAAEVQQVLMPRTIPDLPGYELAGQCVPTQAIGGDFFSWQVLRDGSLQLHLADVMGKGIPAALIAATVRAALVGAAQYNDQHQTLHRAAAASWELLNDTGAFVTAFTGRLDPSTGELDYIDAGHGLAFILGDRGLRHLERSGPPLGIFPDTTWQLRRATLEPGETLVIVSDGYLDFFPTLEEALEKVEASRMHTVSAQELVDRAVSYARANNHPDDVTVLALRRTSR